MVLPGNQAVQFGSDLSEETLVRIPLLRGIAMNPTLAAPNLPLGLFQILQPNLDIAHGGADVLMS